MRRQNGARSALRGIMKDAEWCAAEGVRPEVLEIARAWERDYFERKGIEHDVRVLAKKVEGLKSFDDVFLGDYVSRTLKRLNEEKALGRKWPPSHEEILAARERHADRLDLKCEPGTCVICDGRWDP